MPRLIRKSPKSVDPRNWYWLPWGFQGGGVPPYKWALVAPNGPAYFPELLDGLVPTEYFRTTPLHWKVQYSYDNGAFGLANLVYEFYVTGTENPPGAFWPPGTTTVVMEFRITVGFVVAFWGGQVVLHYPDPYADQQMIVAPIVRELIHAVPRLAVVSGNTTFD